MRFLTRLAIIKVRLWQRLAIYQINMEIKMDRDEFIKLTEKILKEQIQELTSDLEDRQGN